MQGPSQHELDEQQNDRQQLRQDREDCANNPDCANHDYWKNISEGKDPSSSRGSSSVQIKYENAYKNHYSIKELDKLKKEYLELEKVKNNLKPKCNTNTNTNIDYNNNVATAKAQLASLIKNRYSMNSPEVQKAIKDIDIANKELRQNRNSNLIASKSVEYKENNVEYKETVNKMKEIENKMALLQQKIEKK
jgi:hypothetical protein